MGETGAIPGTLSVAIAGSDSAMAALQVSDLVKDYPVAAGLHRAVDGISFSVEPGHFYTLLGPSGCGKTTTLRCVAGLERPDRGRILLDGNEVASGQLAVPPERRDIGMVFQNYAIWPHMSVFENVAFPLRVGRTRVRKPELTQRVDEALDLVQLSGYAARPATQLSGGQQQRLALARALIRRPSLLLLDEPLSNLDARLRDRMRSEIRALQRRLGITTLFVTHDQVEALSMSNRIAVMDAGRIVQEGTPRDIYQHPATRFVAGFVGSSNLLSGTILGAGAPGRMRLRIGAGELEAECPIGSAGGDAVTLSIRPENVGVHLEPPGATNVVAGIVGQVLFVGDALDATIDLGGIELVAHLHPTVRIERADRIWVELPVEHCAVIHDDHGVSNFPVLDTNIAHSG
jgi:iron(III) transport system ATP-binding protein